MKRLILVVLVLACMAATGFAVDVGIGATGSYYMASLKATQAGIPTETLITGIPFGFMAFVDVGYLQISAGYRMLNGYTMKAIVDGSEVGKTDVELNVNYVSLAAYGKFPIELGPITFFPMVGVEYDRAISGTSAGVKMTSQDLSDATEFWIKGGVGADISVSPQFYIRPEVIVGYKLLSGPENDLVDATKAGGGTDVSMLDLGFELSVLFGIRL